MYSLSVSAAQLVPHAFNNTDLLLTFNETHAPLQLSAESPAHRDAILLMLRERQSAAIAATAAK